MTVRASFGGGACAKAPLPKPTTAWFGKHVMKWGGSPETASARRAILTREELEHYLVTLEIAVAWRECYYEEYLRTLRTNDNALYRAALMDRAVELLGGTSSVREYLEELNIE